MAAVDIMKLEQILIIQNKVDVIFKDEGAAQKNYDEITNFIKGTKAQFSPIIPCSAQLTYNVDAVCQNICEYFTLPKRNLTDPPRLIIIR